MVFLLAWKWNLSEKAFSSVKTKTNPNFAVNLLKGATIHFYCQTSALIMEYTEHNWLCKHMKKIRSSQPVIPVLNWVKHQSFPVSIVKSLKSKKKQLALTLFYVSLEIWLGNSKKLICIDQSRFYIFSHLQEFKNA